MRAIKSEKIEVDKILANLSVDLIISDNRYGINHDQIPSVFISHQLNIQTPYLSKKINRIQAKLIDKFNEVWVPDFAGDSNLSGRLSIENRHINLRITNVGPMSSLIENNGDKHDDYPKIWDYLILLSGPEPQRTILEKKIIGAFKGRGKKVLMVRGVVSNDTIIDEYKDIEIVNSLFGKDLLQEINQSGTVICRPGYSTIMDLIAIGKPAIFIPTPGQTEQEYLANYHNKNSKSFYSINQRQVSFEKLVSQKLEPSNELIEVNRMNVIEERLFDLLK